MCRLPRAARLDVCHFPVRPGYLRPSSPCLGLLIGATSTSRQGRYFNQRTRTKGENNTRNSDGGSARTTDYVEGTQTKPDLKGKLTPTPSRLFKLVAPLTTDGQTPNGDPELTAFLIHPNQPLSHLERLVQSELHPIEREDGYSKLPKVSFTAPRHDDDAAVRPRQVVHEGIDTEHRADSEAEERRRSRDENKLQPPVRWALSTEIGDFIRDASQVREFVITIESASVRQILITVPSFSERTRFLRARLRNLSKRIEAIAEVKHECDALAHRGGQRVALCGFGVLASWWYLVYRVTFETDLGWDTMEPVTYLASLSTLMGGYLWFLYHNREISYRSALEFTISARQRKLYQMKGVDLSVWESLIDEGNILRKEIKNIATEYDVYWDERADEQYERVTKALKEERNQKNGANDRSDDDDEGDKN